MNILLSCVGRRSYLVEYFKSALVGEGIVVGTNSEAFTSGMSACDKSYVVPAVNDEDYIPTLLDIAKKENIKMIISLFDIDLPFLAKSKKLFQDEGIEIIVSSEKVIEIANDKYLTYQFLKENNFHTPKTFINLTEVLDLINKSNLSFPLFIKPRFGMGSIGVYKADNIEELNFFYKYVQKQITNSYLSKLSSKDLNSMVLIQEAIIGQEFGIDILNDLNGNFLINISKEKVAMRSGETDISVVIKNTELDDLSEKLSSDLKHIGNLDIDVLFDGKNYYILELNPRFGGGFPFSYMAGANFPKMLIDLVNKDVLNLPKIKIGTKCLKKIVPIIYKDTLVNK